MFVCWGVVVGVCLFGFFLGGWVVWGMFGVCMCVCVLIVIWLSERRGCSGFKNPLCVGVTTEMRTQYIPARCPMTWPLRH